MANVYDYVAKYGKYTFEQKAFNEVDNLVFSLLAYLDFTDTRINENNRTLEEVGREYLGKHSYKEIARLGIAMGTAHEMLQKVVDPWISKRKLKNSRKKWKKMRMEWKK